MSNDSTAPKQHTHWHPLSTPMLIAALIGLLAASTVTAADLTKLIPPDPSTEAWFGFSVAVAGDIALIGVPFDDNANGENAGAVWVYNFDGTAWVEQQKLLASDGAGGDAFGVSIAISGNTAVIGAVWDADNGPQSGSAYVFVNQGGTWSQEAKLLAPDGAPLDAFGSHVAIDDDTILVGAYEDDDLGDASGSAYAFVRNGTAWSLQDKLLAFDGAGGDWFGRVAIVGDLAIIGADQDDDNGSKSGSAYAFRRYGNSWLHVQKILPHDGQPYDEFANCVRMSGDRAVIAANTDDDMGANSGSAYVYEWDGTRWVEVRKLLASDGSAGDEFGSQVAIDGDIIVVGAGLDDPDGTNSGAAYVFEHDGGNWPQRQKLRAPGGRSGDLFGYAVAVGGDTVLIGAQEADAPFNNSGAAYIGDLGLVFDDCNGNGVPDDQDIAGGTSQDCNANGIPDECDIASGTSRDDNGNDIPDECECPPDLNGDGIVNTQDFIAYLDAWAHGDPLADWNDDGTINTQDFIAYLNDWASGCP